MLPVNRLRTRGQIMTHLIDKVIAALKEGDRMSAKQISQKFGTHISHARNMAKKLHGENKVHICDWSRPCMNCAWSPIYAWGSARDVNAPLSHAQEIVRRAEKESYVTIARLRQSVVPGLFDPFRVLRAQVGAA